LYIASVEDVNIITADGTVNSEPVAYEITRAYNSSATVTIDAKDVLHLKNPNIISPNTNYGLSKLFGQQKAYTASTLTFEARNNAYTNGGKSGVLSPKGSETIMLPVEQKAMQERFDHDTTGVHNFGGVHVSGAPVDYTRISLSPEQLQLIESVPTDLRHLCAVYNVDPMLFGDSEGAKFDNLKTAEARMEKTATMNGSLYDDELNRWLIQGNYDLDICYKIDEKDEAKEAKLMQRNTDKGKDQVTGIVKSFKADELDEAAAIGNLTIQYAYTEDEAKILLGL
jgi:phage portal protein BeeE